MADWGGTSVKDSDIFYDFYCTVCEEKGKNVEAIKRCEDCNENMCADCLANHNMFKAMREHSLIDKQDVGKTLAQDGGRPNLPRVKCEKHVGNRVELYCVYHDDVGCATCSNTDHKLCKDMHYVPDVAVGIKSTSEPRDVADSLGSLVNRAARVKKIREEDLMRVTAQRDTAAENIEQRVDAIKQRLDDLKVAAIADVDAEFKDLVQKINSDIDKSQDVINKLQKEERRLKAAQNVGESDLFVYVKQGRAGMREGEKVVHELEKSRGQSLRVAIDEMVLACVTGLETFVELCGYEQLTLALEQKPNIRMADDQNTCAVTDCCILDNGTMLLADGNNKCVKLFDKSYKALDRCAVQGDPVAVCAVGTGEVAMTLITKKAVQFAKVDRKIRLTRSFTVGEKCRGISFSYNRLYISCGGFRDEGEGPGHVRIYDTSGTLLQTFKHDNLDIPHHIMATRNGGCIVANCRQGILAFDNKGKIARQYQHADLKGATGICEVDDQILVGCYNNGHVFQVNPADQSINIILRGSSELKKPYSLTYDLHNDKLIVTKDNCNHMFVYKINRQ